MREAGREHDQGADTPRTDPPGGDAGNGRSVQRGKPTLAAEVTNISVSGLWILVDGRELFLSFTKFPWFREATVAQLTHVRRPSAHHLCWPDLDVDLAVESLEHPDRFPLVSRERP
jgi:hypothetical protein